MSATAIRLIITRCTAITKLASLPAVIEKTRKATLLPVLGVLAFLLIWQLVGQQYYHLTWAVLGPNQVWEQSKNLVAEHQRERSKEVAFMSVRKSATQKSWLKIPMLWSRFVLYTGKATFFDQIRTELFTVAFGFMIATLLAVPLGIICNSEWPIAASTQLFKP